MMFTFLGIFCCDFSLPIFVNLPLIAEVNIAPTPARMITAQIHLSTYVSAVARLPMVTVISGRIIKKGRTAFVFCSGTAQCYILL